MCKEQGLAVPLTLAVHPSEEETGIPTKGQVTQRPQAWETFSWEGCWLLPGENGVAVKRGSTLEESSTQEPERLLGRWE